MICILSAKDGKPNYCERHEMFHDDHYALYAVDPGEKGQRFRGLWDRWKDNPDLKRSPEMPSYAKMMLNYFSSLREHVAGGSRIVADSEKSRRRKRCDSCQFRHKTLDACSLCGCALSGTVLGDKLAWATSKCFNWEKVGVALGCYNLPKLTELQIQVIADKCGPTPILICDDSKPGSPQQLAHAALAKKYPNVKYWPNAETFGHHKGDASVFWKAIQWGKREGMEVVCKLSMRHIFNIDNWLKDGAKGLLESGQATGAVNCIDNDSRLFIRSEAVLLDVNKWFDSGAWKELQGRQSYAPVVELHYNHVMCQYFGEMDDCDEKGCFRMGARWKWPILNVRRFQRTDGIIWHCANSPDEYHQLAKKYGIELDADFHTDGSQKRAGYAKDYKIG